MKSLIIENQTSESIRQAKNEVMKAWNCSREEADEFVRNDIRAMLPILRCPKPSKFILGVTRMFLDGQLVDVTILPKLFKTIEYISSNDNYDKYNKNLNNLSAKELVDTFYPSIKKDLDADRENIKRQNFAANDNGGYKIVPINSFEEAKEYEKYCNWCICEDDYYYDLLEKDLSGKDKGWQLYFLLKNGYENLEVDDDNIDDDWEPKNIYDEYGMSMIALYVDGEGDLMICKNRYNTDNGFSNSCIMTTQQISNLIGKDFYEEFPPKPKQANESLKRKKTKKTVKLTENMLREMVRKVISEKLMRIDEASKHDYRGELRKVIYDYLNKIKKDDEDEITDEDVSAIEEWFYESFLHGYSSYKDPIKRIVPIFVRLALEHGFIKDNFYRDDRVIKGLRSMLTYIREEYDELGNNFSLGKHEIYIKKLDKYKTVDYKIGNIPNDITYEELKELCTGAFNEDGSAAYGDLNIEDIDYSNSKGYDIEADIDFERASEIGEKSGYSGEGKLCYTTSEGQWDHYTNSGENTVYVLLKDGYENMRYEKYVNDPKRPYDDYGLSMIFLFVDPNGNLVWSNTRWNHEYQDRCPPGKKTDKNFTKGDIVEITGLSFDDHFIPVGNNKNEEYLKSIEDSIKKEGTRVDYNYSVYDLDEAHNYSAIYARQTYQLNVFDHENNRFLYPKWFDYNTGGRMDLSDGAYYKVAYGDRNNIIKPDGSLMFEGDLRNWPYNIFGFSKKGIWQFRTDNNKFNFIDYKGNILFEPNNPDEWFNSIITLPYGSRMFDVGRKDRQFYAVTKYGEIMDLESAIKHFLDKGNTLREMFGSDCEDINDDGLYKLSLGSYEIMIREDGTLVTDQPFSRIYHFHNGFAAVYALNGTCNYIDKDGNIIYKPNEPGEWFDWCFDFNQYGFGIVEKNGKRNLMTCRANLVFAPDDPDKWFDNVSEYTEYLYTVRCGEKFNFIRKDNATLASPDIWFDGYTLFDNWLVGLEINGKHTLMDNIGNIYKLNKPEEWFDDCQEHNNGFLVVRMDRSYYYVDKAGRFYDIRTLEPVPPPTRGKVANESIIRLRNKIQCLVNEAIQRYINKADL